MKKDVIESKVWINTTLDEERFMAVVYLQEGQRLQDIVNDDRAFLPVLKEMAGRSRMDTSVYKMTMINKSIIAVVEEV